jgi:hypothetical protein
MDLEETEARNDCAGEGRQKCNQPTQTATDSNKNLIWGTRWLLAPRMTTLLTVSHKATLTCRTRNQEVLRWQESAAI